MNKDEWGTPFELFNELEKEFVFTLDPCADLSRRLKRQDILVSLDIKYGRDGLEYSWYNHRVFINPPYSGNNIKKWMKKAFDERHKSKCIVLLIPTTKTGTRYFKKYAIDVGAEFRFITGRVPFIPLAGQKESSNPLYSMLVIWRR